MAILGLVVLAFVGVVFWMLGYYLRVFAALTVAFVLFFAMSVWNPFDGYAIIALIVMFAAFLGADLWVKYHPAIRTRTASLMRDLRKKLSF